MRTYDYLAACDPGTYSEEKNLLQRGKMLLLEEKYQDARKALQSFISKYPNSELVEEAYALLGDSYHDNNRMQDAINQYEALLARFPASKFAPQTQFKIGDAYFV